MGRDEKFLIFLSKFRIIPASVRICRRIVMDTDIFNESISC